MQKSEAIQAMKDGHKVAHMHFTPDEWVKMITNNLYLFEDGVQCTSEEFWLYRPDDLGFDDGWEIYNE